VLAWMRIASDDEEPPNPRQRGDNLLDNAIDKIFLFGVTAHGVSLFGRSVDLFAI
jgi:hypothetical protein